jgi:hypothetical protein
VLVREELLHGLRNIERRRAGIALVAALDGGPLVALIAPVPESVSRSMSTSSACTWNRL